MMSIAGRSDRDNARESREPRPRGRADSLGKLTEAQKEYVVHRLAAYDRPSAVQKGLEEEFGVEIARQSLLFYDPTKPGSRRLREKWKSLFHATREALHQGSAKIGACHALVRIRWREQMALKQMEADKAQLANDILDSIARDVGDCFGSKYRHDSPNGAPFVATINITGLPEPAESYAIAGCAAPADAS
jgi:hypothetical protein